MQFFEQKESQLIFRNDGETMIVSLWGNKMQLTFTNSKGEVLLKEVNPSGAPTKYGVTAKKIMRSW